MSLSLRENSNCNKHTPEADEQNFLTKSGYHEDCGHFTRNIRNASPLVLRYIVVDREKPGAEQKRKRVLHSA